MQNPISLLKNLFGRKETSKFDFRPDLTPQSYAEPKRPSLEELLGMSGDIDVSAYNPDPEQTDGDPWIAARNFNLQPGSLQGRRYLAVPRRGYDRNDEAIPMIPYGTMVNMGGQDYEVRDMMGLEHGPKNNRIPTTGKAMADIFIPDETPAGKARALQFGRKNMPLKIMSDPWPLN